MGPIEAIKTVLFKKYATFKGRASRSEFWYFFLFNVIVSVLLALSSNFLAGFSSGIILAEIILNGFDLLMFVPFTAVVIRRLHDKNMSGWWSLIWIVSFILITLEDFLVGYQDILDILLAILGLFLLVLFISFALKGTRGANRFGADPLAPKIDEAIFS